VTFVVLGDGAERSGSRGGGSRVLGGTSCSQVFKNQSKLAPVPQGRRRSGTTSHNETWGLVVNERCTSDYRSWSATRPLAPRPGGEPRTGSVSIERRVGLAQRCGASSEMNRYEACSAGTHRRIIRAYTPDNAAGILEAGSTARVKTLPCVYRAAQSGRVDEDERWESSLESKKPAQWARSSGG